MSSSLIILYIALKAQSVRFKTMSLNNHKTLRYVVAQHGRFLISGAALHVNIKNDYYHLKTYFSYFFSYFIHPKTDISFSKSFFKMSHILHFISPSAENKMCRSCLQFYDLNMTSHSCKCAKIAPALSCLGQKGECLTIL